MMEDKVGVPGREVRRRLDASAASKSTATWTALASWTYGMLAHLTLVGPDLANFAENFWRGTLWSALLRCGKVGNG